MSNAPAPEAQAAPEQPVAGQAPATSDTSTSTLTPEQILKELKEARAEAAKYRKTVRDQETAAQEAQRKAAEEQGNFKTLYEQAQQKQAELQQRIEARERLDLQARVAKAAGLPDDLASRLQGATPEELAADAAALAKLLAPAAPAQPQPPATGATNPAAGRGAPAANVFDPKNPPRLSAPGLFKQ